jgi:hypothetical protein
MKKRGSLKLTFISLFVMVVVLLLLYLLVDFGAMQLLVLVLLIVVVSVSAILLVWEHTHGSARLERKMSRLESLVPAHAVEELESIYNEVYHLFMKLPLKHRDMYFDRLHAVRTKLESHIKTEKKVKRLLPKAAKGRITQKRKVFAQLMELFHTLPSRVQDKYFQEITILKQRLEGKKK